MEGRRVAHIVEREWLVWRRLWRGSVFTSVLSPVLFLAAMGIGLGDMVDKHHGAVNGTTYLVFITPGLMAASTMMQAATSSMWPVMGGVKWLRTYHAAVSTPVRSDEVYLGELLWTGCRVLLSSTIFLCVAAVLGGVPSPAGVWAVPAAVLGALAVAAPLSAWAVGRTSDSAFILIMRVVVFPLFLFSGTFFPISRLPDWLEPLAQLSPLYHAGALCRAATTGSVDVLAALGHVLVLAALVVAGVSWGRRSFAAVLER